MHPNDILNVKLEKSGLFGYKVEDVDNYIEYIHNYVSQSEIEKQELEAKIKVLAEKIKEYKNQEENIREALLGAQKLATNVVNEAKEKAEKMIYEAKDRATSKVKYAQLDAEKLLKETKFNIEKEQKSLLKIQKEVSTFKAKLLSIYKSHLDLITALPELEPDEKIENSSDVDMNHKVNSNNINSIQKNDTINNNSDEYVDLQNTKIIDTIKESSNKFIKFNRNITN